MAAKERQDPWLTPRFRAERFNVPAAAAGFEVDGTPSKGEREWGWIGDKDVLAGFGAAAGEAVDPAAFDRVARGLHAESEATVRNPNPVKKDLAQIKGSYRAAEAVAEVWRAAGPEERQTLAAGLLAEAQGGISRVAAAERFAGAATLTIVGEGAEATPQVDWVAFGADRGNGPETPYDRKGIKQGAAFEQETAARLRERLRAREQERAEAAPEQSERAAAGAERAEAAAQERVPVGAPGPRSERVAPEQPPPELPSQPLRDSLTTHRARLGDQTARESKSRPTPPAPSSTSARSPTSSCAPGCPPATRSPGCRASRSRSTPGPTAAPRRRSRRWRSRGS